VLSCWLQDGKFKELVEDSWKGMNMRGWAGYVSKERLTLLKGELKRWNKDQLGKFQQKKRELVEKIHEIDL